MNVLPKHAEKDPVAQKILFAIGCLAACHPDNNTRLLRLQVIETIDSIFTKHIEGEAISHGSYRAIAGLAANNPAIQNKFSEQAPLLKTVVRSLYHELESDICSRWGCVAITALARKHSGNQSKLGYAVGFHFFLLH
jgi:hypothetical protein